MVKIPEGANVKAIEDATTEKIPETQHPDGIVPESKVEVAMGAIAELRAELEHKLETIKAEKTTWGKVVEKLKGLINRSITEEQHIQSELGRLTELQTRISSNPEQAANDISDTESLQVALSALRESQRADAANQQEYYNDEWEDIEAKWFADGYAEGRTAMAQQVLQEVDSAVTYGTETNPMRDLDTQDKSDLDAYYAANALGAMPVNQNALDRATSQSNSNASAGFGVSMGSAPTRAKESMYKQRAPEKSKEQQAEEAAYAADRSGLDALAHDGMNFPGVEDISKMNDAQKIAWAETLETMSQEQLDEWYEANAASRGPSPRAINRSRERNTSTASAGFGVKISGDSARRPRQSERREAEPMKEQELQQGIEAAGEQADKAYKAKRMRLNELKRDLDNELYTQGEYDALVAHVEDPNGEYMMALQRAEDLEASLEGQLAQLKSTETAEALTEKVVSAQELKDMVAEDAPTERVPTPVIVEYTPDDVNEANLNNWLEAGNEASSEVVSDMIASALSKASAQREEVKNFFEDMRILNSDLPIDVQLPAGTTAETANGVILRNGDRAVAITMAELSNALQQDNQNTDTKRLLANLEQDTITPDVIEQLLPDVTTENIPADEQPTEQMVA